MSDRRAFHYLTASTLAALNVALALVWTLGALGRQLIGSGSEEHVIILGIMAVGLGVGTVVQQSIRRSSSDAHLIVQVVLGLAAGLVSSVVYIVYPLAEVSRVVLYAAALLIGAVVGILLALRKRWLATVEPLPVEPHPLANFALLCLVPVAVYVVVARISLAHAGAVLGLAMIASAMIGLAFLKPARARLRATVALAGVAVLLLVVGLNFSIDWTERPEQRLLKDPIIHRQLDRSSHLIITKRGDLVRLYVNGQVKISSRDEAIYSDMLVHPAMTLAPSRARVLLLGGGDGMALHEVLRYDDVEQVTVAHFSSPLVELASSQVDLVRLNDGAFADPRVTSLPLPLSHSQATMERILMRNEHRVALHAPNMEFVGHRQVLRVDAGTLLEGLDGRYDVAILDLPDPYNFQTAKLYSVEMFRALRERLTDDAVVALQSSSVFYAKEAYLCVGTTLRSAGFSTVPYHQNVPSLNEWGFYVARPGLTRSVEMLVRLRSINSLSVETRFATPAVIAASTFFGKGWLESGASIVQNSSTNAVLLHYYARGWNLF